jgi:hypothetical protein
MFSKVYLWKIFFKKTKLCNLHSYGPKKINQPKKQLQVLVVDQPCHFWQAWLSMCFESDGSKTYPYSRISIGLGEVDPNDGSCFFYQKHVEHGGTSAASVSKRAFSFVFFLFFQKEHFQQTSCRSTQICSTNQSMIVSPYWCHSTAPKRGSIYNALLHAWPNKSTSMSKFILLYSTTLFVDQSSCRGRFLLIGIRPRPSMPARWNWCSSPPMIARRNRQWSQVQFKSREA